jgi:glyoxylase-like metal-dependent hydrolase (beta-lactamase superfamily II)
LENEDNLFPDVEVRFYDGHTPGQVIPFIHTENKTVVYTSDFIPTSASIPLQWIAAYDLYPVKTMAEKEQFLEEATENNYILFFEHDYFTECATVQKNEKGGFVIKEKFNWADR